jgi:SAM-dependent methyltransferase
MINTQEECLPLWRRDIEVFLETQIPRYYQAGGLTADVGVGDSTNLLKRLLPDKCYSIDQSPHGNPDILFDVEKGDTNRLHKFDNIFLLEVLEHSERPWKLAENLYKMLNPNGVVFVSVPCFLFWHPGYPFYGDHYRFLPGHEKFLFEMFDVVYRNVSTNSIYGGGGTPLGMMYILRKSKVK